MRKFQIYKKADWNDILYPCTECTPFPCTDSSKLKLAQHFIRTENEVIEKKEVYFLVAVDG